MNNSISIVAIAGLAAGASAQISVNGAVESFDSTANVTASNGFFSDGAGDFFTADGNFGSFVNYNGGDGNFFAAMDIDGEGGPATQTLSFAQINIANYTNLQLTVDLAEDDDGTNEDWDVSDFVSFQASIDGGGFFDILNIESIPDGDSFNAVPAIDTDFNGDGNVGFEITSTFQTFLASIAGTGSTLDLRAVISLDSGDEDIASAAWPPHAAAAPEATKQGSSPERASTQRCDPSTRGPLGSRVFLFFGGHAARRPRRAL